VHVILRGNPTSKDKNTRRLNYKQTVLKIELPICAKVLDGKHHTSGEISIYSKDDFPSGGGKFRGRFSLSEEL